MRVIGDIETHGRDWRAWKRFMDRLMSRFIVGQLRYGVADSKKRYLARLKKETEAYTKSGNKEHLFNICVYAFLESIEPEHMNAHFDPTVDSATRGEMGGNIA